MTDDGRLQWTSNVKSRGFDSLSDFLKCRIFVQVVRTRDATFFDLDNKTSMGFQPELLAIDLDTREWFRSKWPWLNVIVIKMSSTESNTDFADFASLKCWTRDSLSHLLPKESAWPWFRKDKKCRITLQFDLETPSTLDQLRVKINTFIEWTFPIESLTEVCFSLRYPASHGYVKIEHITNLAQIRHDFVVALSHFHIHNNNSRRLSCPNIYADGHGTAVELMYLEHTERAGQSYPIRNAYLEKENFRVRNYVRNWEAAMRSSRKIPSAPHYRMYDIDAAFQNMSGYISTVYMPRR